MNVQRAVLPLFLSVPDLESPPIRSSKELKDRSSCSSFLAPPRLLDEGFYFTIHRLYRFNSAVKSPPREFLPSHLIKGLLRQSSVTNSSAFEHRIGQHAFA